MTASASKKLFNLDTCMCNTVRYNSITRETCTCMCVYICIAPMCVKIFIKQAPAHTHVYVLTCVHVHPDVCTMNNVHIPSCAML